MGQIIDSRGWIIQEFDTDGYVGYVNQVYGDLYMIAQENTVGTVTSTRYYIAQAKEGNDFPSDWDNRAALEYKYWSDWTASFGKLLGRFS